MKNAFNPQRMIDNFELLINAIKWLESFAQQELLEKINLYCIEYVPEHYMEELKMAFKSVGQAYGFVSIADAMRREAKKAHKRGLEKGREEGLEKGREEGVEIGRKEGRISGLLEMARSMVSNGIPIAKVVSISGFSEKEILAYVSKN